MQKCASGENGLPRPLRARNDRGSLGKCERGGCAVQPPLGKDMLLIGLFKQTGEQDHQSDGGALAQNQPEDG